MCAEASLRLYAVQETRPVSVKPLTSQPLEEPEFRSKTAPQAIVNLSFTIQNLVPPLAKSILGTDVGAESRETVAQLHQSAVLHKLVKWHAFLP